MIGCVKNRTRARPRKSLGQHWLRDRRVLRRIAEAAGFTDEDTVVEVGAGTGLLTRLLAQRARRLIAVEVDSRLAEGLREAFGGDPSVAVVEADITAISVEELLRRGGGGPPYVVAGNLPYFIGTAIVRKFLYAATPPRWLIVTLQREVAESIVAQPGRMTYLAVEAQLMARARILFRIPPRAFQPPPKVWSAVVRLDLLEAPEFELDSRERFLEFVRAGFAAPRKQIRNSLAIGLRAGPASAESLLETAGVDPKKRPAELALSEWRDVYFAYRRGQREAG
jgi:16S rRNA (adenine1518-N6/adenine1519-N6)-dimethyltransferase